MRKGVLEVFAAFGLLGPEAVKKSLSQDSPWVEDPFPAGPLSVMPRFAADTDKVTRLQAVARGNLARSACFGR
eukprot:2071081-Pyramimonas_sp.AAC.1